MVRTYAPIGQTPILPETLTRDHRSMIGALTMAILRNGSNQMGWPTFMQEIIIGIVIIIAVGIDKLRQRGSQKLRG